MKFQRIILGLLVLVLVAGTAMAQAPTPDAGWAAFVIREGGTEAPFIVANDDYVVGAIEFGTTESGQKAGLGTNLLNGAMVSEIVALHVDRLDDVASSGSLWGPYFNIWVTDGLGNYAVVANEPSNPEWDASNRWNVEGWDVLKTKTCKVYETPGAGDGTSWLHVLINNAGPLTFEDIGDLVIAPPPVAYILDPANAVGTGAPDELGTNIAYGYTWVFGDTAANYVTGGDGFIVDNYYVLDAYPVQNVDQGTSFLQLQPAIDAANPGEAITISAFNLTIPAQVVIDKDLSITGAGATSTVLQAGYNTTAGGYVVSNGLIYVDYGVTATIEDLAIDGSGFIVREAIQSRGAHLTVRDCEIRNIHAAIYDGRGIVFLTGTGLVEGCTVFNTQRIGIHIRGGVEPVAPVVDIDDLTFTGKGLGDFLDYGVEFGGGGQGSVANSSFTACLGMALTDSSESAGILVTDYYGTGTTADISDCSITGNTNGMLVGYAETDGSLVTVHGCLISGNTDIGLYTTGPVVDAVNNNWGDASGPLHVAQNPSGLGDGVSDGILYIPWVGRTVSVVADLGATPTGAFFWEGTPAIGVDDDSAVGFAPGAIQAPNAYVKYGFDPEVIFGREVLTGELYKISYFTKKGTLHATPDLGDWFMQFYTDPYDGSPGSSWYGHRINSEPYFSENLVEVAGEWTAWQTEASVNNRLRFFDSSNNYYGGYEDGFLADLAADPVIAPQPIMIMGLGLGTAWAASFDGLLDGLTIELVSGETMTLNFLSGNAQVTATPAASGPFNCSQSQVVTFGLELTDDMPDVFLYNAVVRATSEVSFGPVVDLLPFGTMNNNFYALDNGDGSWTITGSTVGSPTYPVTGPDTADLFSIEFMAEADGTADITFDSLVLRDPDNVPIPVVTTGATIEVDCTAPNAVTGITAAPHHNRVEVGWAHDGLDVDHYLVYHGVWYDTTPGVSAYPEYDDLAGFGEPTHPAAGLPDPGQGWVRVDGDAVIHPVDSFFDVFVQIPDDLQRGVYAYEVYAVDAAGNVSPPATANDHATNYWLGDMNGDGAVNPTYDISVLGAAFGEAEADDDYNAFCDVGPTDDWSRVGIPTTDNVINFEDLMVFSMNFGVVTSSNKARGPISAAVGLEWVSAGDDLYALRLVDGEGVKGVRVRASLDEGATVDVTAGDLLDEQGEMTFLRNIGTGLDACVTVMGRDNGFTGYGDLMIIDSRSLLAMTDLTIDVRGHDNSKLEVSLTASTDKITPRVFALNANFPNPFNPMTKISFSLPEAQDVRLSVYGIDGTRVATLVNETRSAGLHEVLWMGRNDAGQSVASGMYFYRIEAGPYSQVRKMVLMK